MIGNGSPIFARAFREDLRLDTANVTVLVDESLRSYALLGLKRSLLGVASLGVVRSGARAYGKGFRQGRTMGDAMQLGGVVVVRPGGRVVYAFASNEAGDHPSPADVVAAVRQAGQVGARQSTQR